MTASRAWACPVCGHLAHRSRFRTSTSATENGVDASRFRPASTDFGTTAGVVVRCRRCGHGSLLEAPGEAEVDQAYVAAADESSIREEPGQVATARRDLAAVDALLGGRRGRLLDVGCWTGSFVAAADAEGWQAEGLEPSAWATDRARQRGLSVRQGAMGPADGLDEGSYTVVVACDVLEHLLEPAAAVARLGALLEPGGVLFATVPDAGSRLARLMGRRWWSVLPMHVQYYTRSSFGRLLEQQGLVVREVTTHPKLFSRRYYGERIGEFVPLIGPAASRIIGRTRGADGLIGPDFRDRMAVIAQRPVDG